MQKVKLGDVCEILDNQRVPITASERKAGPYPYYGANGLQDHVDGYIFDDELVLLAEDGGNFGSKEKPIAYRVSGKCWVNNHAHVLKPKGNIDVNYLCYSLMFYDVSDLVNGATRQKLTQKDMQKMTILLLPLEEQKAIAEKLDKVSILIEKRKQQLSLLDTLVKSKFVEMFGDVLCNSKGWIIKKGRELFKFSSGKFLPEEKRKSQGIPVYGGNGITWFTDQALIDYSTIIIGRVGAYCGNVRKIEEPVWITDNAIYVKKFLLKINLTFLHEMMRQMKFYQFADFSGQPKVTQKPLEECNYILPPLDLQEKFTDFVKQTEKTKAKIKQSLAALELLKKSLMQKYFGRKEEGTDEET